MEILVCLSALESNSVTSVSAFSRLLSWATLRFHSLLVFGVNKNKEQCISTYHLEDRFKMEDDGDKTHYRSAQTLDGHILECHMRDKYMCDELIFGILLRGHRVNPPVLLCMWVAIFMKPLIFQSIFKMLSLWVQSANDKDHEQTVPVRN